MTSMIPLDKTAPQPGELVAINNDLYWLRMPLPFALDHINLYAVRDKGGWALIDTGVHTQKTTAYWEQITAQLDNQITRVIATHMHPDHIGCAGFLTEKYQVPLHMSQTDYFATRALFAGSQGADNWTDRQYFTRAGFAAEAVARMTADKGGFKSIVSPMPLSFIRMRGGDSLTIGDGQWQCILGEGHAPEHISLYNADAKILIAGDQILPEITPNIGSYSTQPESNPLAGYLSSLDNFAHCDKETLVLPSHRQPFVGVHERIAELKAHHQTHLDNLLDLCMNEQRIIDLLPHMFARELNEHGMFFAIAEAYAHINFLLQSGQITRREDNGVFWYTTCAT